jgi:hypothetical protein
MIRKYVALLAATGLVSGMSPVNATDQLKLLSTVNHHQAEDTPPPPPPPKQTKAKKGKGKGKGNSEQQYMTIKMENVYVSGRTAPQRPRSVVGGGLLDNSSGGFNRNAPSATGTPLAPAGGRGGGGGVIK